MTDARVLKKTLQDMKDLQKELAASPERATALLVKAGILTRKGNLRKPYK